MIRENGRRNGRRPLDGFDQLQTCGGDLDDDLLNAKWMYLVGVRQEEVDPLDGTLYFGSALPRHRPRDWAKV